MNDDDPQQNDEPLAAPRSLVVALTELQRRAVVVPSEVDAAILDEARQHLRAARQRRRASGALWPLTRVSLALRSMVDLTRFDWFRFMRWAAAAVAACVVVVWLVHTGPARRPTASAEDVNRDGQVDILDAFALARQLQQGDVPRPQWDLNGDGVIDERDVETLAARAVSLEKGGHS